MWGDIPRLRTLLLPRPAPRHALHAWSPSGEPRLQPKQSALCKRPSLLLERRVPARPSPAGAWQINERLGFSTQSLEPGSPCRSRSAHASGPAGVSTPRMPGSTGSTGDPLGRESRATERRFLLELPGLSKHREDAWS